MGTDRRDADAPTWADRLAAYRARLDVVPIGERIAALRVIGGHHDWLRDQAEPLAAQGARTLWLEEAMALAAAPAASHGEAIAKVACFQGALASGLATDAILDQQQDAVAMIVAASAAESERWSLEEIHAASTHEERSIAGEPSFEDTEAYCDTSRRWTIDEARGRVELVERDLIELTRAVDPEGIAGALGRLRLEVIRAAATPTSTIGDLEAKQAILRRQAGICEPAWLVDPMIGAALQLDYRLLALTPSEEARLKAQLPLDPTEGSAGSPACFPK